MYGSLGLLQALAAVVASLLLYLSTLAGAKALHSKTLLCLMHCPMAFFDTTPQGRIMNRFSKGRPLSPYPVLCFTFPDKIVNKKVNLDPDPIPIQGWKGEKYS